MKNPKKVEIILYSEELIFGWEGIQYRYNFKDALKVPLNILSKKIDSIFQKNGLPTGKLVLTGIEVGEGYVGCDAPSVAYKFQFETKRFMTKDSIILYYHAMDAENKGCCCYKTWDYLCTSVGGICSDLRIDGKYIKYWS